MSTPRSQKKGSFGKGFRAGLDQEDQTLENRFKMADAVMEAKQPSQAAPPAQPEAAQPAATQTKQKGPIKGRFSFALPPAEDAFIDDLIKRMVVEQDCLLNRSQVIRMGISCLRRLTDGELGAMCLDAKKRGR
jgi:hypothetical protein